MVVLSFVWRFLFIAISLTEIKCILIIRIMANKTCLSPDEQILREIFPTKNPSVSRILAQTFENCTFVALFDDGSSPGPAQELVVRLESSDGRLPAVLALQRLASLVIPELVPKTLKAGKAKTKDGVEYQYSVTEFVGDTVVLESVWEDLDNDQQLTIMDSIIDAMKKLQMLSLNNDLVRFLMEREGVLKDVWLGGPDLGYFTQTAGFLHGVLAATHPRNPNVTIENDENGGGIIIHSTVEDLTSVDIAQEELESLKHQAVLCHNDLEPRNILVRANASADGKPLYEIAAIIDWEMAGFYPPSYEYGLKDPLLGSSNLFYSWYSLFKQRVMDQLYLNHLPQCQLLLMQAVDVIHESWKRKANRNVGVRTSIKFIEREQLERGPSICDGWVRKPGAQNIKKYTSKDTDKLEEEVLKELGLV